MSSWLILIRVKLRQINIKERGRDPDSRKNVSYPPHCSYVDGWLLFSCCPQNLCTIISVYTIFKPVEEWASSPSTPSCQLAEVCPSGRQAQWSLTCRSVLITHCFSSLLAILTSLAFLPSSVIDRDIWYRNLNAPVPDPSLITYQICNVKKVLN